MKYYRIHDPLTGLYYASANAGGAKWCAVGEFFRTIPSTQVMAFALKYAARGWDKQKREHYDIGCSPLLIVESEVEDSNPVVWSTKVKRTPMVNDYITEMYKMKWIERMSPDSIVKLRNMGILKDGLLNDEKCL